MSLRAALGGLLAAALLGGCGGPSADLFVVERTGSLPGARLTIVVDDGGFVRCNGGDPRQISSDQLIDAREIARALNGATEQEPGPARRNLVLAPGPGAIMRYDVRSEGGSVAFADTSKRQPQAFYRVAQLTRVLAKQVCGLPR